MQFSIRVEILKINLRINRNSLKDELPIHLRYNKISIKIKCTKAGGQAVVAHNDAKGEVRTTTEPPEVGQVAKATNAAKNSNAHSPTKSLYLQPIKKDLCLTKEPK